MHDTLPRLRAIEFPAVRRGPLTTLQINLGYRCNQSCLHCHVNAGLTRREQMSDAVIDQVSAFIDRNGVGTLDITGGAPELHPRFRDLVTDARARGLAVIDRCNLTVLHEPGQEGLAEFLAAAGVEIVASLPCYLEENVDAQRGEGVYAASIRALRTLNALGYGMPESALRLNLMYNPVGAALPPGQAALEADYRRELHARAGVSFNRLYVLANMPIKRFGSTLVSNGGFDVYMDLLRAAHRHENLDAVMCRSLISVDWQGYVYDCDFNQMLGLEMGTGGRRRLEELIDLDLSGMPVRVAGHCYGCTAGQGSSCGGAIR